MRNAGITTRLVRPDELDAVWALVERTRALMLERGNDQWASASYPTRDIFGEDIANGELWCAVDADGTLLGVAALISSHDPDYENAPFRHPEPAVALHRLAVDPGHEGKGAACALFDRCEQLGRSQGVTALRVDTYAVNDRMQALIRKQGYEYVGDIYYDRPMANLCYEKVLKEETAL